MSSEESSQAGEGKKKMLPLHCLKVHPLRVLGLAVNSRENGQGGEQYSEMLERAFARTLEMAQISLWSNEAQLSAIVDLSHYSPRKWPITPYIASLWGESALREREREREERERERERYKNELQALSIIRSGGSSVREAYLNYCFMSGRRGAHLSSVIGDTVPRIQVAGGPTGSFSDIGGSFARTRECSGSQTVFLDESGGRYLAIHIYPPQQGDQGLVATARKGKNGPGKVAENALISVFGGVVPLCLSMLDDTLKDGCPGYIRAATYVGLGLISGITLVGLVSKKRAPAAIRVVASMSIAAVSTSLVYRASENVYIKCVWGIIGAVATLAPIAIGW